MELGTKRLDLEVTSCIQYIGDTVTMNIVSTVYHNEDSYQVFGLIYIYIYVCIHDVYVYIHIRRPLKGHQAAKDD